MLTPDRENLLELLIKQEELMADLYQAYAHKFPDMSEFWTALSREEREHAGWVAALRNTSKKGTVHFDRGKINVHTLNTFVKGIEGAIRRTRTDDASQLGAITYALDLENSLFEKDLFGHFEAVSAKASRVLKLLRRKTAEHRDKISAEKNLLRAQQP